MNVTKEINNNYIVYGASEYTASKGLSASKQLNYAAGPSLTNPEKQTVSVIPHTFKYKDSVGLMGAENYFTKVILTIAGDIVRSCFEEEYWSCAKITPGSDALDPNYSGGIVDFGSFATVNTYVEAVAAEDSLPFLPGARGFLSVDLSNLKTGNAYVDKDLDVRLYTMDREEHPFDKMYLQANDYFYIGFHARNTKRINYDIECTIGTELRSYDSIADKTLIMRKINSGCY
tara:strand:- start:1465 stop:2157 length:693 start_codon:yes stop_codon:yes gene_type:complete